MNQKLRKSLLEAKANKLSQHNYYRKIRRKFIDGEIQRGNDMCFWCGRLVKRYKTQHGKHPRNLATLDHYIPVWFLRLVKVPELIVDERNFRISCLACNHSRSCDVRTVGNLRADIGDRLVDWLMEKTGIHADDDYKG